MRNDTCPICGVSTTESMLHLNFPVKGSLPTYVQFQFCERDNFIFSATGSQAAYDKYYEVIENDSNNREVVDSTNESVAANEQCDALLSRFGAFFDVPRTVLDFGCGDASLISKLAKRFSQSSFLGFEPGPASSIAARKARMDNLSNLSVLHSLAAYTSKSFDLIIASHVIEHLVEFGVIDDFGRLLKDSGLLYIEVPDAISYDRFARREFLYYFDRLHVNHFTAQALERLVSKCGFVFKSYFTYSFPYRDGGRFPALGMMFRKGKGDNQIALGNLRASCRRYIEKEQARAKKLSEELPREALVWGIGDNFFRSLDNGGPLSCLSRFALVDRRLRETTIRGNRFEVLDPRIGMKMFNWPIVTCVSERRGEIRQEIERVDPGRRVIEV